jgi:hypothetical protein
MGNIITLPDRGSGYRPGAMHRLHDAYGPAPGSMAATTTTTPSILTFTEVVDRLGWSGEGVGQRQLVKRLRTLHDRAGLPAPRGLRIWGRRIAAGSAAITARSTWDRFEFLRWYDNSRPSGPAAASDLPPPPMACLNATARRVAGGCDGLPSGKANQGRAA